MLSGRQLARLALVPIALLGFKLFFDWWTYSRPEYDAAIGFMKQNPAVLDLYGTIQSYSSDEIGTDVEWRGNGLNFNNYNWWGTNQFNVVGAKRSGKIIVHWKSDPNHNITFLDITGIPEGEEKRVLWTAK